MPEKDPTPAPKREYPPFYEKAVPIAMAIIVASIVILLLVVLSVLLGLFPTGG